MTCCQAYLAPCLLSGQRSQNGQSARLGMHGRVAGRGAWRLGRLAAGCRPFGLGANGFLEWSGFMA
jgi:hypothetical protein